MKRIAIVIALIFLMPFCCLAEDSAKDLLTPEDIGRIQSFSDSHGADIDVSRIAEDVMQGKTGALSESGNYIRKMLAEPFEAAAKMAAGITSPVLLMALLGNAFPDARGGAGGARFVLTVSLLGRMSAIAAGALGAAQQLLITARDFSDMIAPVLSAVITAAGMSGSAALISPSSALAGNIIGNLFFKYGLPACRYALILSAAGSLSPSVDLSPLTGGIKKTVNWCCGLAGTLFAALVAVQNNVAATADSAALKTAKYTVDSFSSVIGSGVSDAWNTYISGVSIARNAVGVSGAAAMLAAGMKPLAEIMFSMLILNITAMFLKLTGESGCSKAADQLSGVCQMALALSCGSAVISVILVSAVMFAGRGMLY